MSELYGARVLVVGCGGIGGILAAGLTELGANVSCVTGNEPVARALNERGARVRDGEGERTVRGMQAWPSLPEGVGGFDYALLAVQPPRLEAAAAEATPVLAPDGRLVCLQNGLAEERLAPTVGAHRIIGAVVGWGASQLEPGHYERTSPGGFALGYLDGHLDAQLARLGCLLECVGPVDHTSNLRGSRWSKLAINCAISALGTLGGDRLGVVLRSRRVRRLALELMTETVQVARAEGVRLEKVSGTLDLDWIALTDEDRAADFGSATLLAKHAMLLAVGARFRRMRSSMLAAIERGRPPAVDYLNGEVVERGRRHRIPTPVNAAIQSWIHEIARGERRSSIDQARALYAATSAVRGPGAEPESDE